MAQSIDINGKRYDATTGAFLGNSLPKTMKPAVVHSIRSGHSGHGGKSMDGFTRVSKVAAPTKLVPIPHVKPVAIAKPVKPVSIQPVHAAGVKVQPHSQQRSETLMRSAVKKPVITAPSRIKAQSRTDLLSKVPLQTVVPKMSYNSVNVVRHQRAERLIKSPSISRYTKHTPGLASIAHAHTPVSKPASPAAIHAATTPLPVAAPSITVVPAVVRPVRSQQSTQPISRQARPLRAVRGTNGMGGDVRSAAAYNPQHSVAPNHKQSDMFEKALADARSHEQQYEGNTHAKRTSKRSRVLRYVSGGLIGVVAVGFLAYANMPALSLQIASYKSGLHAKVPAAKPSGYTLGSLAYQPGNVTVKYTAANTDNQFNIVQKASNWDSQALLSNFVTTASAAYKTYQQAGRTVYVLGNNTATWVDSGVWYTVDGNSSLSAKQLLDVAGSM